MNKFGKPDEPVFKDLDYEWTTTTVWRRFKDLSSAVGSFLAITPRVIRRSSALALKIAGRDVDSARQQLRHAWG